MLVLDPCDPCGVADRVGADERALKEKEKKFATEKRKVIAMSARKTLRFS